MRTKIIGTGSYVPDYIVTNEELSQMVETSDEWIRTRTGIRERRISREEGTTVMAAKAARRAMDNAGISAGDIDLIIAGTSTADSCFPSAACEVQGILGADHGVAYDISAACSGFIFALNVADAMIKTGLYRTALVIGADNLSKVTDWSDRSTCVLFGDGAGAAVVRDCSDQEDFGGIICTRIGSDGQKSSVLQCRSRTMDNYWTGRKPGIGYITMEGQEVFKFAVKKVPECIERLLSDSNTDLEDIKYLILHQANYRICESIARRLKISMDRIPMNIEAYGNTSGATIPILLDELNRKGNLIPGDKVILAGFGAGLTWGASLIQW